MPVCFMQKRDFLDSLMAWKDYPSPNNISPDEVVRLISEDYACRGDDGFRKWQQGFTPKEHRDMMDREMLLRREDARDDKVAAREDRRDKREFWQAISLFVAGAIVAFSVERCSGNDSVTNYYPVQPPAIQSPVSSSP